MADKGKKENSFLGLGSNLGDRQAYFDAACRELSAHQSVQIIQSSSLYESEPVGYLDQGWFLNQVVEIETTLEPEELLHFTQDIENKLGRKRLIHWGPRVIDIDILLYGDRIIKTPHLTVPHPRMYERCFVLMPLREIAADLIHPDGISTQEHLEMLQQKGDTEKIRLFKN
jgi:2-amino-4-hydroxy-6-hydroxymethyldihydropteridine diphosphokinase